jgi:hypothetical protein
VAVPPLPSRVRRVVAAAATAALVTTVAPAASAEPQTTPNGPWVQPQERNTLEGFRDHVQLVRDLESIESSSRGRMSLEIIGSSNEGRDIHLASVGEGERTILYLTQQHGNEPHGTEAAVQALRTLASSDQPAIRRIREELTVLMVVRANPDGSERYWRQNVDPDCDATDATCLPGRGYDPNRWHDPRIDDSEVPVPETVAMRETVRRYSPELVVDYHGQLSYRTAEDEMVTTSVLWPIFPDSVEVTPERQAAIDDSKRVSRLVYDTLESYGHGTVTLYPPGSTMGTARNAYAYDGAASVLLEQRADVGQKSVGMLVRQAKDTMLEIAAAVADGRLADIDPATAEAIPPRGPRVTNPNDDGRLDECRGVQSGGGTGDVRDAEGELYDAVVQYATERILTNGSQAYVRPTEEEACTMAAAYGAIVDGREDVAADLVEPYDYEVVRLTDPSTDRDHVLLAELPAGDQVARGWGLYVHTPDAASSATVQAAYPLSATFSERLAAQAFDAAHASDLMVAGAHRGANAADDLGTEPANVTQDAGSVFHRVHQQVTEDSTDRAVQVLGGSVGGTRGVAVTSGEAPPGELATDVAGLLEAADFDVCLYGDGTCTSLPSTTNVQGQWSRSVDAGWAALYPSFAIRNSLVNRAELAGVLAPALQD